MTNGTTARRLLACSGTAAVIMLIACGDPDAAEETPRNGETENAVHAEDQDHDANDDHPDRGSEAGADSGGSAAAFAEMIAGALATGETAEVIDHVEGVGLPEGWQGMIGMMFADMNGRDLTSEVRAVGDFTREELQWPEGDLPQALGEVEQIMVVSYEETEPNGDSSSGHFTFPLVQRDGAWKILLVGPGG